MNNETQSRQTSLPHEQQFVCQQMLPQPLQQPSSLQPNASTVYMHSHGYSPNENYYNHHQLHHTHVSNEMGQFVTLTPPIQYAPMPEQTHYNIPVYTNETKEIAQRPQEPIINIKVDRIDEKAVAHKPEQIHYNIPVYTNETKTTAPMPEVSTNDSESNSHTQSVLTPSAAATNLPSRQPELPSQIPSFTTNVTSPSTSIHSTSQAMTPFTEINNPPTVVAPQRTAPFLSSCGPTVNTPSPLILTPPTSVSPTTTIASTPQLINNTNINNSVQFEHNGAQPMMWHCHLISSTQPDNISNTQPHPISVPTQQTTPSSQNNEQTPISLTNMNTVNNHNTVNTATNPIVYMPIPANALQQYYQNLFPLFHSNVANNNNNADNNNTNNMNNTVPTVSPRNVINNNNMSSPTVLNNNNNNNNRTMVPGTSTNINNSGIMESRVNLSNNAYMTPNAVVLPSSVHPTNVNNESTTVASNHVSDKQTTIFHNAVPEEFTMLTLQPGTVLGDGIPFCPKGVIPLKQYARRPAKELEKSILKE